MIIAKDIHPEKKIYYLGVSVLKELKNSDEKKLDFLNIYRELNKNKKIPMQLFILTLDWLFLLGAIESEKGYIKKCF
ncbi:MAG: hypothetical protein JRJ44_02615 [Deltaproteobacteria bacterium]|nr:hypothetical protein [Deltaproteobacteria bacterium]